MLYASFAVNWTRCSPKFFKGDRLPCPHDFLTLDSQLSDSFISSSRHSDVEYSICTPIPSFSKSSTPLSTLIDTCFSTSHSFAFIALKSNSTVYFGIDKFSKSSLLIFSNESHVLFSSFIPSFLSATSALAVTVSPGIYSLDLSTGHVSIFLYPPPPPLPSIPSFDPLNPPHSLTELAQIFLEKFYQSIQQSFMIDTSPSRHHCHVLFSGGIDSTLVAYHCAKYISDNKLKTVLSLYNVYFASDAPDKLTAIQSFNQLRKIYPKISINLISRDFSVDEVSELRNFGVKFCAPKSTVMDANIATSLLAGFQLINEQIRPFQSNLNQSRDQSRDFDLVFMGQGADELFIGYHRYKSVYSKFGELALKKTAIDSLIALREGISRDVRVAQNCGFFLTFPFISDLVYGFALSIPHFYHLGHTNQSKSRDQSNLIGKVVIREAARLIGLDCVVDLPKRAIQFGSRAAKLFDSDKYFKGNEILDSNF
ncbi:hypothetical protein RCL1_003487 [Eukaryota sp. TZLM3-RCL]